MEDTHAPLTLWRGAVSHARVSPTRHAFTYEVFMPLIDIDILRRVQHADTACAGFWPLLSSTHAAVAEWSPAHHMRSHRRNPQQSLGDAVRDLIERESGERPDGRILLLTNFRYFGYVFNPVSFYYAYTASGALHSIIAEVTNTPWGEEHQYVLHSKVKGVTAIAPPAAPATAPSAPIVAETLQHAAAAAAAGAVPPTDYDALAARFDAATVVDAPAPAAIAVPKRVRFRWDKAFHVSPFMPMDHVYEWIFSDPRGVDTLLVQSQNVRRSDGGRMFNAQLRMSRVPLTFANLAFLLFIAFPFLTFRIQLWIHVEAFALWWKGVQLFPHPHGSSNAFTRTVEAMMTPIMLLAAGWSWLRAWLSPSATKVD